MGGGDSLTEDVKKIQDTVSSWRTGEGYEDVEGYCKSSNTEEIEKNGFFLTPGRYVGFADEEDSSAPFEEKIKSLVDKFENIEKENPELTKKIQNKLLFLKND